MNPLGIGAEIQGQNVINPIAAIAAGQMMLDHLGETKAAQMLDKAISDFWAAGHCRSQCSGYQKVGYSTSKIGDDMLQRVQDM